MTIILFDIVFWILGYLALVVGSSFASYILIIIISLVFSAVVLSALAWTVILCKLNNKGTPAKVKRVLQDKLDQCKHPQRSKLRASYTLISSAAEVAILFSFGWIGCALMLGVVSLVTMTWTKYTEVKV